MRYPILCGAMVVLSAGQGAWADLTIRHSLEFKFASFLPPATTQAMKNQFGDLPKEAVVQIKGQKVYTSMARLVMVADFGKGIITLMDPATRKFAVSSISTYADRLAA